MSTVLLDVGWTIHGNDPNNPNGKTFYPFGGAPYPAHDDVQGRIIHRLLVERTRQSAIGIGHRDASLIFPHLELLWREISPLFPVPTEATTRAGSVALRYHHNISRRVAVASPGEAPATDELMLNWQPYFKGEACGPGQGDHVVARIRDLSTAARSAARQLDGYAGDVLFRAYTKAVEEISGGNPMPGAPPLAKIKTFISYRKPWVATAKRVHNALAQYGHGAFFEPFLDEHDVRPGDWKTQFEARIRASDLFMPICTDDYAASGSVSDFELGLALSLLREEQIAVVRIGSGDSPAWQRLKHLHARVYSHDSECDAHSLDEYLGQCVPSALAGILTQPASRSPE